MRALDYIELDAVGADPEVFFWSNDLGMPMSAEGLVGGSKAKPLQMEGLPEGYCIQEDNVAAEYNIPPQRTSASFADAIARGLGYINKLAKKQNLKVMCVPELDFDPLMLMTSHAQELGCEPDLNVWLQQENPRPTPPKLMRTAAGHVHVSWANASNEQRMRVIQMMDFMLGVPSVLITKPSRRRELYGKAGACRYKPYGVEYRVLDNFWLPQREYCKHIFSTVLKVVNAINGDPMKLEVMENNADQIQEAINKHDTKLATALVQKYQLPQFPVGE